MEVRRVDWMFPPSNHVVGSPGNQPPSLVFSKLHLIYINSKVIERGLLWILRHLYCSPHLGNSRHFRTSVSEAATKTYYAYLTINHSTTPGNFKIKVMSPLNLSLLNCTVGVIIPPRIILRNRWTYKVLSTVGLKERYLILHKTHSDTSSHFTLTIFL